MFEKNKTTSEDPFISFNTEKIELVNEFIRLIGVIGNGIFRATIDLTSENLLGEIQRQPILEAEKNLLKNLLFFSRHLKESRFLLGIMGRFKSGKSTVINTLAGNYISPIDTRVTTGVLTFNFWAHENRCSVVYQDGRETEISPDSAVQYIDYKTNPENEKCVDRVIRSGPGLDIPKEIIFVDTPGLEACNTLHEKITVEFARQCHTALIISTYPSFGESELRFYESIQDVIPSVFLVQNLPSDKLQDWLPLESETVERLFKLGFFVLDEKRYPLRKGTLRDILADMVSRSDLKEFEEFKKVHGIHLYSVNAKEAWDALQNKDSPEFDQEYEKSRFDILKQDLYKFLALYKGKNLIHGFLAKGQGILVEIRKFIELKKDILNKDLSEIDLQIEEGQEKAKAMTYHKEVIMDRTKLKIIEEFREFRRHAVEVMLQTLLNQMEDKYGNKNIYLLSKEENLKIKQDIQGFNQSLSYHYREFLSRLNNIIVEAEDKVSENLKQQCFFHTERESSGVEIGFADLIGVGYIDSVFKLSIQGGMAYIVGSISGGGGIAILAPLIGLLGIASGPAALTVAAIVGGLLGFGLAIPLQRYLSPVLDFAKGVIGYIIKKPIKGAFEHFKQDVRSKLDEIEKDVVEPVIKNFTVHVEQSYSDFLSFFAKTLQDLREKKESGKEKEELRRLEHILSDLKGVEDRFIEIEKRLLSVDISPESGWRFKLKRLFGK